MPAPRSRGRTLAGGLHFDRRVSAYQRILCPVDFSSHSRTAYAQAIDLAAASGGSIMLMHVYQTPLSLPPIVFDPSLLKRMAAAGEEHLAAWKKDAEARGVPIETMNIMGTPWERIVTRAREGRHDLVVVGTHGRTGIKFVLLGSVAEYVVRYAPCSVMVVRPDDQPA